MRPLATATIIYFRTFAALLPEHVHNLVQKDMHHFADAARLVARTRDLAQQGQERTVCPPIDP